MVIFYTVHNELYFKFSIYNISSMLNINYNLERVSWNQPVLNHFNKTPIESSKN